MSKAAALYQKYFPVYLVIKWLLIVAALAFVPKMIGGW